LIVRLRHATLMGIRTPAPYCHLVHLRTWALSGFAGVGFDLFAITQFASQPLAVGSPQISLERSFSWLVP